MERFEGINLYVKEDSTTGCLDVKANSGQGVLIYTRARKLEATMGNFDIKTRKQGVSAQISPRLRISIYERTEASVALYRQAESRES